MNQHQDGAAQSQAKQGNGRGLAGWLLGRLLRPLRGKPGRSPRLAVIERIALAPRQALVLVEADGRRFLVAIPPDGTPAFQPLDEPARKAATTAAHWPAAPRPTASQVHTAGGLNHRADVHRPDRISW